MIGYLQKKIIKILINIGRYLSLQLLNEEQLIEFKLLPVYIRIFALFVFFWREK